MKKKIYVLMTAVLALTLILAGCNNAAVENAEYTQTANGAEVITKETAMRTSTSSQKINSDDVTFTSVELDTDGGRNEYEVEFIYNGYKYKVDIDAATGNVKDVDKEPIKNDISNVSNSDTSTNDIGRDAALNAALDKAGLTGVVEADLEYCIIELDRDDGRFEYDIEFIYNDGRYDISVSAEDGRILDYDFEAGRSQNTETSTDYIGKDAALKIALGHAKLSENEISRLHIAIDKDDGRVEYDVEFVSGYTEYDYDIDALSGEIINFDRDGEHTSAPEYSKPSVDELISYDDAKVAAYSHAGVSADKVYDLEIELDEDDGVMKYEIEFKCEGKEYEYDVSALDGSIIRFDKGFDD